MILLKTKSLSRFPRYAFIRSIAYPLDKENRGPLKKFDFEFHTLPNSRSRGNRFGNPSPSGKERERLRTWTSNPLVRSMKNGGNLIGLLILSDTFLQRSSIRFDRPYGLLYLGPGTRLMHTCSSRPERSLRVNGRRAATGGPVP